ncbi:MAG: septal ring lytic transglycosylase RlpA family protein [Allosphingosinicella sp.]
MTATRRKSATHTLVALALLGLTAPVQAVGVEQSPDLLDLKTAVAALPDEAPAAAPVVETEPEAAAEPAGEVVGIGEASYYGNELAGNRTASGERFNPQALTAAHRSLPMGSKLRVTNTRNGKSVVVRVNDRGPFAKARILDLSLAAAHKINMVRAGKARVKIELLRAIG